MLDIYDERTLLIILSHRHFVDVTYNFIEEIQRKRVRIEETVSKVWLKILLNETRVPREHASEKKSFIRKTLDDLFWRRRERTNDYCYL